MKGIDVSCHNGFIDWIAVKEAGIDFAICRTGYGKGHMDNSFKSNVEAAISVGLKVGAYHYSYALTAADAIKEALLCKEIIDSSGVLLELPVFFDMEDADYYKKHHGFDFRCRNMTNICKAFLMHIGLNAGVYSSFSWFESYIDWRELVKEFNCPIWNAQWSNNDYLQGYMWQFTDNFIIKGERFDANIIYDEKHQAGLNPWNA